MAFKEVHLVKPFTSKATNGEFYIVGKYFTGLPEDTYQTLLDILDKDNFQLNQTFFSHTKIPGKFIVQVTKFIEEIVELNVQSISLYSSFKTSNNFLNWALDNTGLSKR